MLVVRQNFIPVLSSEAGLCLTAANWLEANVSALSYSLEVLLHKPGINLLQIMSSLPDYLGWSGTLILNASSMCANREGIFTLRSPFDGSKVQLSAAELLVLIIHLQPHAIILPKHFLRDCPQFWEYWPENMLAFFHVDDMQQQQITSSHGVYFNYPDDASAQQLATWSHLPRYVVGPINAEQIKELRAQGIELIESDEPAQAALKGQVYSSTGHVDLTQAATEMQFEPIDSSCACPSCTQKFTKGYFHHLLQHTPLLCQRFLIQHNIFWLQQ